MKKGFRFYAVLWAILFILFNLCCFITPNYAGRYTKFGGAFWVGYIFIVAAFIAQLVCAYFVLKEENKQKLFYNIPIIKISYTGLIFTIVVGALTMMIPGFPKWLGALICIFVALFTAISVTKAKFAADTVAEIDEKVKAKTEFIKMLTVDAELLQSKAATEDAKKICKQIYEEIRYSDPVSDERLELLEKDLSAKFAAVQYAVTSGNTDMLNGVASDFLNALKERNLKCKALK